jgi:hypothetical protein
MIRFYVEDAAHDAVLKSLNFQGSEIQQCTGRARTITLAIQSKKSVGLIDDDNGIDKSNLKGVKWKVEDDFKYSTDNDTLFILFSRNVEDWLDRSVNQYKVEMPDNFKITHGSIVSKNENSRKLLQKLIDAKPQPSSLVMLKNLIRQYFDN